MADKIFAQGISFFDKNERAPDWVLGTLSISANKIQELAVQVEQYKDAKGYCKFQVTKKQDGKNMVAVDTYGLDLSFDEKVKKADEGIEKDVFDPPF